MNLLRGFCVIACFMTLGSSAIDYGKITAQLWSFAAAENVDPRVLASRTVYDIAKLAVPSNPFQTFRGTFGMKISPSLEGLFKQKSFLYIYNSFKSFGEFNRLPTTFNMSLLEFLSSAASFDSQMYTVNVLKSISGLAGNASIGPYLNTTDAKLQQRNYLSDLYPILASNIDSIMDGTKGQFFSGMLKMPEKTFRSIVGNDTAIEALLKFRKQMALATIQGSMKGLSVANVGFQRALQASMKKMLTIASRALSLQGMQLYEAKTKCNISLEDLKLKSLLQLSLICIRVPEDFPIMKFMPESSIPKEAFTMRLDDMARKIGVPFDNLLQYTADMVIMKYVQSKKQVSFVDEPLYHVSRRKGKYIVDLQHSKLYELAMFLSGLDGTNLNAKLNTSMTVVDKMRNVSLAMMSSIVKSALFTEFPQKHFYFLPLSSLMVILDSEKSEYVRVTASQNLMLYPDKGSYDDAARILGMSKAQLKRTPLLNLVSMMTGKKVDIISDNLSLSPLQKLRLMTLDLETAEELQKVFGAGDLKLDRLSLFEISSNHVYTVFLTTMKDYFRLYHGSMNSTLRGAFKNDMTFAVIKLTAKKMGVKDFILNSVTLDGLRSAFNKSPEDFGNQTLFAVLKDMRELGKSQIPSPDFDVSIRELSAQRGVLISSFAGKSLLEIFKGVTQSSWQIPFVLKSMKGSPALVQVLKTKSRQMDVLLNNTVEGYESYNFTIRQLIAGLLTLDSASSTKYALRSLNDILSKHFGITSLSAIGIDVTSMEMKPFLSYAYPMLLKSLKILQSDKYVRQYFMKVHNISPQMLTLLRSKTDGDVGQKLAEEVTGIIMNRRYHGRSDLDKIYGSFGRRFAQKRLKDVLKACRLTKADLMRSSVKSLFHRCLNMTSVSDLRRSLNVSSLIKPFSLDATLTELGRILGMHTDQMDNTLSIIVNEKTQKEIGPLFTPLKNVFKSGKIDMAARRNMTLMMLFRNPMFSHFKSRGYLMTSFIDGNNLKIIKERPIDDLVKAVGINDKDLSNTTAYELLTRSISLLKTDPDVCGKLNRMPHLCHKHASCFAIGNSFNCSCEGGYDGDGFTNCADKCKTMSCHRGTSCVTVPGKGGICKCTDRWTTLKNGKCQRIKGFTIKVAKLRLKQEYKKEYADVNSKAFNDKATEIEHALFNSVCKKIGCTAVVVTSIQQGSLVVDFNVVFSSNNVSVSDVQNSVVSALKSSELATLHPDGMTKPEATRSDPCSSNLAKCGANEECIPSMDGYSCSCVSGYQRKDNKCQKPGGVSFVVIIIIIIVAFIVIVSVIVIVIWRWRRSHNRPSNKYAMAYLTNNENETVQLTGGEYAFSYGGEKDGGPSKQGEPA